MRSLSNAAVARWRAWKKEETGSFSLESAMVFPMLFTVVLALLLFGMYIYQQTALYYISSSAAERTAFAWSNSNRDPASGIAPAGQYDGLYWRLGDDNALQAIFSVAGQSDPSETAIRLGESVSQDKADGQQESSASLPTQKLERGIAHLPTVYSGEFAYRNQALQRKVLLDIVNPLEVPLLRTFGLSSLHAQSSAVIVDPVELIRTVDLAKYYTAKWNNRTNTAVTPQNAAEVLQQKAAGSKQ